jgi:hypothetical protein
LDSRLRGVNVRCPHNRPHPIGRAGDLLVVVKEFGQHWWWMIPLMTVLMLFAVLLMFATTTDLGPFI